MRIRGGGVVCVVVGESGTRCPYFRLLAVSNLAAVNLPRTGGVQLHITSLPSGRLGDDAFRFVDWLHDAGQSWWQTLPLGPPDRARSPYKARSAFACWPGLLGDPRAPVTLDEEDAFRTREAYWIDGWAAVAGGRRAIHDQVRFEREWNALRAYAASARRAADRRHPDLRRAGRRRRAHVAAALPPRRGLRGAARRLQRDRPAVGQPAVRLASPAAQRLPLVGAAATPDVRPLRPDAPGSLPRAGRLLGGPGRRTRRTRRALEAWARRGPFWTPAAASSDPCRSSPRTWG